MFDLPTDGVLTAARIAELLAPTLGWEKGSEVVDIAVTRLALPGSALTLGQAIAVLDELARTPGMVGIAARFARSRLDAPRAVEIVRAPPPSVHPPPPSTRGPVPAGGPVSGRAPASGRLPPGTTVTSDDVAALLANAIGADKAQEVVLAAVHRLGFRAERLDKAQAMAVLDHLAGVAGVIGLCARFAKARLILRFAA
jgi:hypothetical protein